MATKEVPVAAFPVKETFKQPFATNNIEHSKDHPQYDAYNATFLDPVENVDSQDEKATPAVASNRLAMSDLEQMQDVEREKQNDFQYNPYTSKFVDPIVETDQDTTTAAEADNQRALSNLEGMKDKADSVESPASTTHASKQHHHLNLKAKAEAAQNANRSQQEDKRINSKIADDAYGSKGKEANGDDINEFKKEADALNGGWMHKHRQDD